MKQSDPVDKIKNKVETTVAVVVGVIYGSHLEKAHSFSSETLNKPPSVASLFQLV